MFILPEIEGNCRISNQIIINKACYVLVKCQLCKEEIYLFIIKSDEEVVREAWLGILNKTDFEKATEVDTFIRNLLELM